MSEQLSVGDRIRMTKRGTPKGYGPGARGKVLWRSQAEPETPPYYVIRMDDDGPDGRPLVFLADEIEPDVLPRARLPAARRLRLKETR
jgi:hypothetical protein